MVWLPIRKAIALTVLDLTRVRNVAMTEGLEARLLLHLLTLVLLVGRRALWLLLWLLPCSETASAHVCVCVCAHTCVCVRVFVCVDTGITVCEGHGYSESECLALGNSCCAWYPTTNPADHGWPAAPGTSTGACWSDIGDWPCPLSSSSGVCVCVCVYVCI